LKAALQCADAITTVSPTYAEEIRREQYGMGLQGLLQAREKDLTGIINGIDTEIWNPGTDAALACRFDATDIDLRVINKRAVEQRFGLASEGGPLYCVVSRLTWQKGIDLLLGSLDRLAASAR
jgi:starch synthase